MTGSGHNWPEDHPNNPNQAEDGAAENDNQQNVPENNSPQLPHSSKNAGSFYVVRPNDITYVVNPFNICVGEYTSAELYIEPSLPARHEPDWEYQVFCEAAKAIFANEDSDDDSTGESDAGEEMPVYSKEERIVRAANELGGVSITDGDSVVQRVARLGGDDPRLSLPGLPHNVVRQKISKSAGGPSKLPFYLGQSSGSSSTSKDCAGPSGISEGFPKKTSFAESSSLSGLSSGAVAGTSLSSTQGTSSSPNTGTSSGSNLEASSSSNAGASSASSGASSSSFNSSLSGGTTSVLPPASSGSGSSVPNSSGALTSGSSGCSTSGTSSNLRDGISPDSDPLSMTDPIRSPVLETELGSDTTSLIVTNSADELTTSKNVTESDKRSLVACSSRSVQQKSNANKNRRTGKVCYKTYKPNEHDIHIFLDEEEASQPRVCIDINNIRMESTKGIGVLNQVTRALRENAAGEPSMNPESASIAQPASSFVDSQSSNLSISDAPSAVEQVDNQKKAADLAAAVDGSSVLSPSNEDPSLVKATLLRDHEPNTTASPGLMICEEVCGSNSFSGGSVAQVNQIFQPQRHAFTINLAKPATSSLTDTPAAGALVHNVSTLGTPVGRDTISTFDISPCGSHSAAVQIELEIERGCFLESTATIEESVDDSVYKNIRTQLPEKDNTKETNFACATFADAVVHETTKLSPLTIPQDTSPTENLESTHNSTVPATELVQKKRKKCENSSKETNPTISSASGSGSNTIKRIRMDDEYANVAGPSTSKKYEQRVQKKRPQMDDVYTDGSSSDSSGYSKRYAAKRKSRGSGAEKKAKIGKLNKTTKRSMSSVSSDEIETISTSGYQRLTAGKDITVPKIAELTITDLDEYDEYIYYQLQSGNGCLCLLLDEAEESSDEVFPVHIQLPMPPFLSKVDEFYQIPSDTFPLFPVRLNADANMFANLIGLLLTQEPNEYFKPIASYTDRSMLMVESVYSIIAAYMGCKIDRDDIDPSHVSRVITSKLSTEATVALTHVGPPTKTAITIYKVREVLDEAEKTMHLLFGVLQRHVTRDDPHVPTEQWKTIREQWTSVTVLIRYVIGQSFIKMAMGTKTKFSTSFRVQLRFAVLIYGWLSFLRQGRFFHTYMHIIGSKGHPKFNAVVSKFIGVYDKCISSFSRKIKKDSFDRVKSYAIQQEYFNYVVEDGVHERSNLNVFECDKCELYFSSRSVYEKHCFAHSRIYTCSACYNDFRHKEIFQLHFMVRHPDLIFSPTSPFSQAEGE